MHFYRFYKFYRNFSLLECLIRNIRLILAVFQSAMMKFIQLVSLYLLRRIHLLDKTKKTEIFTRYLKILALKKSVTCKI